MLIRDSVLGCTWVSKPKIRQGEQEEDVEPGEANQCEHPVSSHLVSDHKTILR